MNSNRIFSPISGEVLKIEKVQDPVFAEKMLGDGIAIKPSVEVSNVVSPCKGEVITLQDTKHAIVLKTDEGHEILIHIGIDTVLLRGSGFEALVAIGDKVEVGQPLIKVDFEKVAKKAPSIDVIMVVTNLEEGFSLSKTSADSVKASDEVLQISSQEAQSFTSESVSTDSEEIASKKVGVINLTGIHARPASVVFQIANGFSSKIELKKEDKIVNAKSVVSILGLGVKYEDEVEIIATGSDAKEAVKKLTEAFESGLGEGNAHVKKISANNNPTEDTGEKGDIITQEQELSGAVASPGLVIGKSFLLQDEEIELTEQGDGVEKEKKILTSSIKSVKDIIFSEIKTAKEEDLQTKVEILEAHLNLLEDPSLIEEALRVVGTGKSAPFSWRESIKIASTVLRNTHNALLIERVADLKDLEKRVIKFMLGIPDEASVFPENSIVVASDLVPSDVSKLDENVKGVILILGSTTSHASLMLRNMGLPTICAVGNKGFGISTGMDIVLNANEGSIVVNPKAENLESIRETQKQNQIKKEENIANCKKEAITKDNIKLIVKGNVSNSAEAKKAFELGAEGIGLLRTEFLFFNSMSAPKEEDQYTLYQNSLDAMQGGAVTFRTLDVGGDKPLSYVDIATEENPIMGMRGVRNYYDNIEIFRVQLRALLKLKPQVLVKIMLPMVAEVSEILEIKKIIEEEKEKLNIDTSVTVGTMIEIPSAAIMAEQIGRYVDFLSIGTNDLAQYTMAMDRGNAKLARRLNNLSPALLKLIKMTVEGGKKSGVSTAVCGAMASEITSVPLLVGLGVEELSTSMRSIPDVKALIRTLDSKHCKEVVEKALLLESSSEVLNLVRKEFSI